MRQTSQGHFAATLKSSKTLDPAAWRGFCLQERRRCILKGMARRAQFRWTPANLAILIVLVVLIALGAMYGVRLSQLLGTQLATQAVAPKPKPKPPNDSRCVPSSQEDVAGEFVIAADPFIPTYPYSKDVEGAKKQALKNAREWVKRWNCDTQKADHLNNIVGGTVTKNTVAFETFKDNATCTSAVDKATEDNKCKTTCKKKDTQCYNRTADSDCKIDKPPVLNETTKMFEGLVVTCAIRVEVKAICTCPTPAPTPKESANAGTRPGSAPVLTR